MLADSPHVLAVLDDLFFSVKISAAAQQLGLRTKTVQTEKDALAQAQQGPVLIFLDLNAHSVQPLSLIRALKADSTLKDIPLIGFVSHVQAELKLAAQEAGCDLVLARSAFSQDVAALMRRYVEVG